MQVKSRKLFKAAYVYGCEQSHKPAVNSMSKERYKYKECTYTLLSNNCECMLYLFILSPFVYSYKQLAWKDSGI